MSYHHPFSPSSLGRRRLCPGSFSMEQKVKKPKASDYAVEGTMLHEVIARRITGQTWTARDLNADQVNAVDSCYEWFKSEIITPLTHQCGPEVWSWISAEESLGLWDPTKEGTYNCIISGTVDVLVDTRDGYAVIVDWKFGRADVSAVASILQLTGYAVLAFEKHDHIQAIEGYIYQPRTGSIKKGVFDREDLDKYKETIKETIGACLMEEPPLAASHDACAYCSAIHTCPAAKDKAFGKDQAVIERPMFEGEEMTADKLGETLDDMKVAEKFLSALKTKCKEVLLDGLEATGWGMGERAGMKFIDDPASMAVGLGDYLSVCEILGVCSLAGVDFCSLSDTVAVPSNIELSALIPHAKVSVPKLMGILTEKLMIDSTTKTEARRQAHELIEEYVTEGPKIHALNRRKD